MNELLQVLLAEYSELKQSERASRGLLYQINGFAVAVVSALIVAITQYHVELLALSSPFIFYLIGFFWSTEMLRLLRLTEQIRHVERELRRLPSIRQSGLIPGFEDSAHRDAGWAYISRWHAIVPAAATFYGIFWILFFVLLFQSSYSLSVKVGFAVGYLVVGGFFWILDLRANRQYLFRKETLSPSDA